jgi:hypothetical protein
MTVRRGGSGLGTLLSSVAAVAAVAVVGATRLLPHTVASGRERLPAVAFHRLDGSTVDAAGLVRANERTVLIVFSPDCQSCVAEAVVWERTAEQLGGSTAFIGAAYTADSARLASVRTDARVTFPIYLIDRATVRDLDADPMPSAFVIDRSGTVLFRASGHMSTDSLTQWLGR